MIGKVGGVATLFKKEFPNFYVVPCTCHSLHLCSSKASKHLPQNVEQLCRNIFGFFSHSSKRRYDFQEFQNNFNVTNHNILKVASTRWLSLQNVVDRVLEQWNPLKHYFLSFYLESKKDRLAHDIYEELNDINKLYFVFLSYILKLTNKINVEFQAESPRLYTLIPTVKAHVKTILSNFVKDEFITDNNLNDEIFEKSNCFKDLNEIDLGPKTEDLYESISEEDLLIIKLNCKNYMMLNYVNKFLDALNSMKMS